MGIGQTAFPINTGMQTLAINAEKRCKRENYMEYKFSEYKALRQCQNASTCIRSTSAHPEKLWKKKTSPLSWKDDSVLVQNVSRTHIAFVRKVTFSRKRSITYEIISTAQRAINVKCDVYVTRKCELGFG